MANLRQKIKQFLTGDYAPVTTESSKPVPEQWKGDSVAQKTGWGPNVEGGTNMRTHKLTGAGPDRLEIRATGCYQGCIGGCMLPFGLLIIVGGIVGFFGTTPEGRDPETGERAFEILFAVGMLLFGLLLVVATFWFFIRLRKGLVMDRGEGFMWKDKQLLVGEDSPLAEAGHARQMPLKEVHALQLISEFVSPDALTAYMIITNSNRSSYDRHREMEQRTYFSYELNLVLSTGERFTVMDHSDAEEVAEAGNRVAEFLKVPLWNVIGDDDYIRSCCC